MLDCLGREISAKVDSRNLGLYSKLSRSGLDKELTVFDKKQPGLSRGRILMVSFKVKVGMG